MTFTIRRYRDGDHAAVRDLFVRINRELARPDLRDAFESYMAVSLRDEIDRLADYYGERQGTFFVVYDVDKLAGVFGLERLGAPSAELRRMLPTVLFDCAAPVSSDTSRYPDAR